MWVHARQRVSGGEWAPCCLSPSNASVANGYVIAVATNGGGTNVGALVYRAAEGFGDVTLTNVVLSWNYAMGGLYGTNQVDLALFAVEMVYIPEGAFYLGDGRPNSPGGQFFTYPDTTRPFLVTNEDAIATGSATGALSWLHRDYGPGNTISITFPKGYRAFYAMKYEVTQAQYADYLNHITPGQAVSHYMGGFGSYRQRIAVTDGVYSSDAPDRACNYLGWDLLCAYLDWAGLRPLTELEYEKMCRGFKYPVVGEYAYGGDTAPVPMTGIAGVDGSGTETASPPTANFFAIDPYGSIKGPVRVGIFATTNSSRISAGAGYFGNMDLTDNVIEQYVCAAANAGGNRFIGEHGDGNIAALPPSWPTGGYGGGGGLRGTWDTWSYYIQDMTVSARYGMDSGGGNDRQVGGRGGHTAF